LARRELDAIEPLPFPKILFQEEAMSRTLLRLPSWSAVVWVVWLLLPGGARADLHFPEPLADAGTVRSGAALVHRFACVNQGKDTAEIIELRPSCGCVKPHLGQRSVQPGAQVGLDLDVNTLSQEPGAHTWSLQVQYRCDGAVRSCTLRLCARIVTEVSVQPAALTVFAGQAVAHELTLTDQRSHPLEVAEVRTSSPRLRGRVTGQPRDDSGQRVRTISLEVAADYPEGRYEEVVDILTDDPDYRDLKVPVTVVKRGRQRLTASPEQVTLHAASCLVLLRDGDNAPVVIDGVESDDPALVCQWARGANRLATVRIGVRREAVTRGEAHGLVRVHVSKPVAETLTIPVTRVPE
jgi:hypothetical protein